MSEIIVPDWYIEAENSPREIPKEMKESKPEAKKSEPVKMTETESDAMTIELDLNQVIDFIQENAPDLIDNFMQQFSNKETE